VGFFSRCFAVSGIARVLFELRRPMKERILRVLRLLDGMLTSVGFGVYPMVLPARNTAYSLTVRTAKAGDYGLKIGLVWWIVGMVLCCRILHVRLPLLRRQSRGRQRLARIRD